MKHIYQKGIVTFGLAVASLLSFAEETGAPGSSGIVSVEDMTGIFDAAQTNMSSLVEAALPVVIAFVSGGLIIWGGLALVSLLKRGFGAGKGR